MTLARRPKAPPAPLSKDEEVALAYAAGRLGRSKQTAFDSFKRVGKLLACDVREIPWVKLGGPHGFKARAVLRTKIAESDYRLSTINLTLTAIRGVLREAERRDLISQRDLAHAEEDFKTVRGSRLGKDKPLTAAELDGLLLTAKGYPSPKGEMMRAIVLVGLGTGLRRAELVALRTDGHKDHALFAVAKGNKEVRCPLDKDTEKALAEWLDVRDGLGWDHPRVFGSPKTGTMLSSWSLGRLLQKLCQDARVRHVSPHSLRRTFATRMLEAGLELRVVQRLMNHQSPNTTALYDRRADEAIDDLRRKVRAF